jgi:neutral ceramidase
MAVDTVLTERQVVAMARHIFRLACAALVGLLVSVPAGRAQESKPTWKAGFARADITPDRPVWMSGYASRDKPSAGVTAKIFAKVVVLEDAEGGQAVLVTADLAGIWPFFTEPIYEAVAKKVELPRERFLFTCAHNHSGPTISLDLEARGKMSKEEATNTAAYTRAIQKKVSAAILDAFKDLRPARLSWGVGVASFVMNRREFTSRGVILGTNPRAPVDRSVPALRIEGADGKLRGVVFGCACHNTTLGGKNYQISGDYAGFAQEWIETRHPGAQALFVTGCAGDANPYPRGTMDLARAHGRTLGEEVCRLLETKLEPVAGPLKVARGTAQLPFQDKLSREDLEKMARGRQRSPARNAQALLKKLERGEKLPTHQPAVVTVWRFGEGLTLVALSGEVVVDYVYRIEKALGPRRLWIAAYAHEVFGYVTSARVQREGGYEAKGIYGKGLFAPEAEDVYVAKVRELAAKVGRKRD